LEITLIEERGEEGYLGEISLIKGRRGEGNCENGG
jgi:hypothetical protein